jgi:EAL domain-containing protein (putative c-di-GMP-specific phosphodiesterase class I)
VVDNYRRNGFAVAVQASDLAEAGALLVHAKPAYLKLDARREWRTRHVVSLAESARDLGVTLALRRCERPSDLELARAAGITYVQGRILPGAEPEPAPSSTPLLMPMAQAPLVQQQCAGFSLTE